MTEDEFTEQLLTAIGKCLVFIRPYPKQWMEVIDEQAKSGESKSEDEPEFRPLDLWHYSALSLIARLTNNGETSCNQEELQDIFLWRHPNAEKTFGQTVINALEDVGLIERSRRRDDRRRIKITLTDLGKCKLAEIREDRRKDVAVIASKLKVAGESNYRKIIDTLSDLGDQLWNVIQDESRSNASQSRGATNKKPRRK